MKHPFTEKWLDGLAPHPDRPDKRIEWQDSKVEGLVVRVLGRKDGTVGLSFYWRRRGKTEFLGRRCNAFNLDAARKEARERSYKQDSGRQSSSRKKVPTLWKAWLDFRETDLVRHVKDRSLESYDGNAANWGDLKDAKVTQIRPTDVKQLHAKLGKENGRRAANGSINLLSRVWESVADELNIDSRNPCRGVKRFSIKPRRRVLDRDELRRFFKAAQSEAQIVQDVLTALAFTGARKGNVFAMKWADIDLEARTWTIGEEEAKAGRKIVIQLVDPVVDMLRRRKNGKDYVFPAARSDSKTPHLTNIRRAFDRICKEAQLEGVTPHTLRKTWATTALNNGVSQRVLADGLGHSDLQSQDAYAFSSTESVRSAAEIVAELIQETLIPEKE